MLELGSLHQANMNGPGDRSVLVIGVHGIWIFLHSADLHGGHPV